MNRDKALELAKYAGHGTQYTNGQPHIWGGEMETQKLEMLIEGVVNECVLAIQQQLSRGARDDYYRGQYDAIAIIKERFGVGETNEA
jgi:uncharacterized membrane protein